MERTFHIRDINTVAADFLNEFSSASCFAFDAEMGAGKTTFICALGKHLGITDALSSPTFSIINEYLLPSSTTKVYHMDWYRLKGEEDAIQAGVQDVLESDCICFIEWPSIAEGLLPERYVQVRLSFASEEERHLVAEVINA